MEAALTSINLLEVGMPEYICASRVVYDAYCIHSRYGLCDECSWDTDNDWLSAEEAELDYQRYTEMEARVYSASISDDDDLLF